MNSETALLITIVAVITMIGLIFAFSSGVWNSVENSIFGTEKKGDGILNCRPSTGRNCPSTTRKSSKISMAKKQDYTHA